LAEKQPSFVRFDVIDLDEMENVYYQEERHSTYSVVKDDGTPRAMILDVPGLLIEHCKSVHEHLPVVDSNHDMNELDEGSLETVIQVTDKDDLDHLTQYSAESFCSHQSSYEILVIPSCHSSLDVLVDSPMGSRTTLVHLIDQEPVMLTDAAYSSTTLTATAQKLVHNTLKCAATSLGFTEKEIQHALDKSASREFQEPLAPSESIMNYSKELTEMSLVGAAVSLGYDYKEIMDALDVEIPNTQNEEAMNSLDDLYSDTIKGITKTAIKQAAVNLGYSEKDANTALSVVLPKEDSDTSLSILAGELAKTAIASASSKLGYTTDSVQNLVNNIESRMSSISLKVSNYSLKSSTSDGEQAFAVITHNALRDAALRLGYRETEVDDRIGAEKVLTIAKPPITTTKVNESEFLIKKFDTFSLSASSIRVFGDSYYECLSAASEEITRSVINSALNIIANDPVKLLQNDYTSANKVDSQYELRLQTTAKEFVNNILDSAKKIVCKDHRVEKKKLNNKKKLQNFALKYSMMIIGSAAKQLGYRDKAILDALSKDISNKSGKWIRLP